MKHLSFSASFSSLHADLWVLQCCWLVEFQWFWRETQGSSRAEPVTLYTSLRHTLHWCHWVYSALWINMIEAVTEEDLLWCSAVCRLDNVLNAQIFLSQRCSNFWPVGKGGCSDLKLARCPWDMTVQGQTQLLSEHFWSLGNSKVEKAQLSNYSLALSEQTQGQVKDFRVLFIFNLVHKELNLSKKSTCSLLCSCQLYYYVVGWSLLMHWSVSSTFMLQLFEVDLILTVLSTLV